MTKNDIRAATDGATCGALHNAAMSNPAPAIHHFGLASGVSSPSRHEVLNALGNPLETISTLGSWPTSFFIEATIDSTDITP